MRYDRVVARKKDENCFPTQEIRARSFARELKTLLFSNENQVNLETQEYPRLINLLNEASLKVGCDFSYKSKGEIKDKVDFISKSRFSGWWNGTSIPEEKKQADIEKVFPNLTNKWFERERFSNRFQLHLATLDLHFIGSQDINYAHNQASIILNKIRFDWEPQNSIGHIKISGPQERAGYDSHQYTSIRTSDFYASLVGQERINIISRQGKIRYDLSLGGTSCPGISIPSYITEIYHPEVPSSIIPYLFCILCLCEDEENSNFKHDLFLDFLSAINCYYFLAKDLTGSKLLPLFINIFDYYYDDYWSPLNKKLRDDGRARQKQELKNDSEEETHSITLDYLLSSFHDPAYRLADTLEKFIKEETKYFSFDDASDDSLYKMTVSVPKLLINLRKFYIDLYRISGLTENQIMNNLLNKFRLYDAEDGSHITTHYPYRGPKPSPY